jgi:O-antigen/teichoic acid export membrane protein
MVKMSTIRKVAKNTGIIMAGDIINKIISLFLIIYLARYLGAIGYGKYSFVFAFLSFFGVITDLGINTIITRDIAKDKSRTGKLVGNASTLKLFLSIIAIVFAMILIRAMGYPEDTKAYVYVLALTLAFDAFGGLYSSIFQANLEIKYGVIAGLVYSILSAALIIGIIFSKGTLLQIIIVITFSKLISFFISYSYSRKFIIPRLDFDFSVCKYLLKESWPLAFTGIFIMIYARIDQVMLSRMIGDEAVGYYSAAVNLVESLGMIPLDFMISIFPFLAVSFGKEEHTKIYELSFRYMNIIIIPIAFGTTLLSKPIIWFFYGNNFLPSVPALQVLIWSEIFVFVGLVYTNVLVSIGAQKFNFAFTGISAVINIFLNWLLIPVYGIVGAGIATVIAYATGSLMGLASATTRNYFIMLWKTMFKPGISSIIMVISIYSLNTPIELTVLLGACVYFISLYLIKGITNQDLNLIRGIIWPTINKSK